MYSLVMKTTRANKKVTTVHEAITFGLRHVSEKLVGDDRNACACYFAAHNYPALAAALHKLGDEYSRKHAGL
jgi:hypothetical protein